MNKMISLLISIVALNTWAGMIQIKTAPIPLLIGLGNVEVGYGTGNLALGIGLASGTIDLDLSNSITIDEKRISLDYIFNSGWYLGLAASSIELEVSKNSIFGGSSRDGRTKATGIIASAGYRWQWETFFMELGLESVNYNFEEETIKIEDETGAVVDEEEIPANATGTALEYNIGWAF